MGEPGVLQSMGLQRVRHDLVTQQQPCFYVFPCQCFYHFPLFLAVNMMALKRSSNLVTLQHLYRLLLFLMPILYNWIIPIILDLVFLY